MRNAVIVLPAYNEAQNLSVLIPRIMDQQDRVTTHWLHVLVVDDNSPDGSGEVVRELKKQFDTLHLITGEKKGLGDAYRRGFDYAMKTLNPDLIFQMDADLQHDPDLIPRFVTLAGQGYSLVIGSRFVPGGGTPGFNARRLMLSRLGNWLLRTVAGLSPIRDCSSGYRCIQADLLARCDLSSFSAHGYSFLSSLLNELVRNGARVIETPIIFKARIHGTSKLSFKDQMEFIVNLFRIRLKNVLRNQAVV